MNESVSRLDGPAHPEAALIRFGSKDGAGAGDRDKPYLFGRRPTSMATYPFSTREYARLLIMRSRLQAA